MGGSPKSALLMGIFHEKITIQRDIGGTRTMATPPNDQMTRMVLGWFRVLLLRKPPDSGF